MTREEAIAIIRKEYLCVDRDCDIERSCGKCDLMMPTKELILKAYKMAIKALEQEHCEDAISREVARRIIDSGRSIEQMLEVLNNTPSVNPQPKTGHCKECKYYDYVAEVNGIPLIVAHEFCSRWGYGCKTKENGYCFLFEPQESEG